MLLLVLLQNSEGKAADEAREAVSSNVDELRKCRNQKLLFGARDARSHALEEAQGVASRLAREQRRARLVEQEVTGHRNGLLGLAGQKESKHLGVMEPRSSCPKTSQRNGAESSVQPAAVGTGAD